MKSIGASRLSDEEKSEREARIIAMLADGKKFSAIEQSYGLTGGAINSYISRVMPWLWVGETNDYPWGVIYAERKRRAQVFLKTGRKITTPFRVDCDPVEDLKPIPTRTCARFKGRDAGRTIYCGEPIKSGNYCKPCEQGMAGALSSVGVPSVLGGWA